MNLADWPVPAAWLVLSPRRPGPPICKLKSAHEFWRAMIRIALVADFLRSRLSRPATRAMHIIARQNSCADFNLQMGGPGLLGDNTDQAAGTGQSAKFRCENAFAIGRAAPGHSYSFGLVNAPLEGVGVKRAQAHPAVSLKSHYDLSSPGRWVGTPEGPPSCRT